MTGDLKTLVPLASAPNSPGVLREGRAAAGAAATPREAAKALVAEKPIEECAMGVCVSGEATGNDAEVNGFHEVFAVGSCFAPLSDSSVDVGLAP